MRRDDFFGYARSLCAESGLPAWWRGRRYQRERRHIESREIVSSERTRGPNARFIAVPPRP